MFYYLVLVWCCYFCCGTQVLSWCCHRNVLIRILLNWSPNYYLFTANALLSFVNELLHFYKNREKLKITVNKLK